MRWGLLIVGCLLPVTAGAQTKTSTKSLWEGLETPEIKQTPADAIPTGPRSPRRPPPPAQELFKELAQTESATVAETTTSTAVADEMFMPGAPRLDVDEPGSSPRQMADTPPSGPGDPPPAVAPPSKPIVQEVLPKKVKKPRSWYGWQTLIASVPTLAVIVSGMFASNTQLIYAGLVGFVFAPPAIHFAHDNVGMGLASFALQVGAAPTVGAMGAYASVIACGSNNDCSDKTEAGFLIGMAVGAATSVVIDSWLLAWDSDEETMGSTMNFAASFDGDVAQAGISGTF